MRLATIACLLMMLTGCHWWKRPSPTRSNYGLQEHRRSYFSFYSENQSRNEGVEKAFEWNYQFSAKADLFDFNDEQHLVFGYTNRTFWQVRAPSWPIRTTDNSPEVFWEFDPPWSKHVQFRLGVMHQSNGDDGVDSRNWNRAIGEVIYQNHDVGTIKPGLAPSWRVSLKPWYVFHRDPDNNGDIENYLGHFELSGEYAFRRRPTSSIVISAMVRNNFRSSGNRGAVEVSISWGRKGIRPFIQFFNGYGESLVDYNDSSSRVSIGFELMGKR